MRKQKLTPFTPHLFTMLAFCVCTYTVQTKAEKEDEVIRGPLGVGEQVYEEETNPQVPENDLAKEEMMNAEIMYRKEQLENNAPYRSDPRVRRLFIPQYRKPNSRIVHRESIVPLRQTD